jgi:O-glycosyl hydrolase
MNLIKNLYIILACLCFDTLQAQIINYQIDTHKIQQTIDGFGASDCWSMQYIGRWPLATQKKIANWLFSTNNKPNGQPEGIGLSIWRFNIGTGSSEQGDNSQISSPMTRSECFLQADGTYNWSKQIGQQNFLRLAKESGVKQFLAFLNSPPVFFTQNGLATNVGRDSTFNLKPECYSNFVHFIADVIEGIHKRDGVYFNYVCPFNEPDGHWNWVGHKQEGTPATNREIAHTIRLLSQEFVKREIPTQILVNESSDYRCMFNTHMTGKSRGYAIQSFFNPLKLDTYIGNVPNVPPMIVGHSYWTDTPLYNLRNIRSQLRDSLNKYQVNFWQTEVCIMQNDEEIGGGIGFDRTMKTALYIARIIHYDLVYAGAKSWQWWRAVGEDYKDGLIREYGNKDMTSGYVEDSKLLWCLGNYSRFIRPGAVRLPIVATNCNGKIISEGDTDPQGLMCSAYKNINGKFVFVIINYSSYKKKFILSLMNNARIKEWQIYRTSDNKGENLLPIKNAKSGSIINIPARAIMTLVSIL